MPAAFFIMTLFAAIRKDRFDLREMCERLLFSKLNRAACGEGLPWCSSSMGPEEVGNIPRDVFFQFSPKKCGKTRHVVVKKTAVFVGAWLLEAIYKVGILRS